MACIAKIDFSLIPPLTQNFLALIKRLEATLRQFSRPDVRTPGFFLASLDELEQAVEALKPSLPQNKQEGLTDIWMEYVCIPPTKLKPNFQVGGGYAEDRLQALLERFCKLLG